MRKILTVIALWALLITLFFRQTQPVEAQANFCDRTVEIDLASGATQTIVAAVNGATVRVCAVSISADTLATTAQFRSGSTDITGAMRLCDECNISIGNGTGVLFYGPRDGNLTITTATGAVTGFVTLGQN